MKNLIQPVQHGAQLLADIDSVSPDPRELNLWWLGQSGFLIAWGGHRLLLDPYLSDSLTEKYAATDKPHVRMTARVIEPENLKPIDVVTSTHNHTDHLDRDTLLPLLKSNPGLELVIPEANRGFVAERLGTDPSWPTGMTSGECVELAGFVFHGIPACHNTLETDGQGRHRFMGYVVEAGGWRLYHAGDTLMFPGLENLIRPWDVDVALLPINGNKPERKVAGNLDGREAARLAKAINARLVVPCHYEMFEFNTASPELFEQECRSLEQAFKTMKAGERLRLRTQVAE